MQPSEKRTGIRGASTLLALFVGLIVGVALARVADVASPVIDGQLNFPLISQALALIHHYYVDRAAEQPRRMTYGAISGIVNSLGDTGHSRFLSPQMVREMLQMQRSKYEGIGAKIQMKEGHVVIVAPFDGSPAERAGLRAGDIILRVNGREITGLPLDQVVAMIAGPKGSKVTLTIFRLAAGETIQVTLTRATIKLQNVTWQMVPGTTIADVRISSFGDGAGSELRQTLIAVKKSAATAVILDLRDNPGGLLQEAIKAASEFLKGGNVLIVRNAKGQEKAIPVRPGGEAKEIPMVVLVNGGTASAAEIVAGALQDGRRALLVGETTFGTGTVLREFKLSDGSALLLAIEEWITPAGHVIWHKGIVPNVVVPLPPGALPVFPLMERSMTAEQIRQSNDAQLLRALKLLLQPSPQKRRTVASARMLLKGRSPGSSGSPGPRFIRNPK